MNLLMLGAVAGGFSGAFGYLVADKIHGEEKVKTIYPVYAVSLFGLMILATKLITL